MQIDFRVDIAGDYDAIANDGEARLVVAMVVSSHDGSLFCRCALGHWWWRRFALWRGFELRERLYSPSEKGEGLSPLHLTALQNEDACRLNGPCFPLPPLVCPSLLFDRLGPESRKDEHNASSVRYHG